VLCWGVRQIGGKVVSARIEQPRQFSVRYGARHPWLAPRFRAGLYLIWRAAVAGFRPALFLSLCAAALWFSAQAFQELPRPAPPAPSLEAQVSAALHDAVPAGRDRHAFWVAAIESSLNSPARGVPDIAGAHAFAGSYVAIRGRDALALELLAEGRRTERVEAALRALPAWERAHRMEAVLAEALQRGRAAGFEPPELAFAPPLLRARLERAQTLFGPALADAETWFIDPGSRALSLQAASGLGSTGDRLYSDIRGAVVQGCALAGIPGRRIGQCRVGFLPKPPPDAVLAGLNLAVAGADSEREVGARIAKAAWAADRLDPGLAARLALGPDPVLGQEAVLAAIMPALIEAGTAWTQPARYGAMVREAAIEAETSARIDVAARDRVFDALTAIRREVGALSAVHLADAIRSPEDAERLAHLVQASGGRVVALHALTGPELLVAIDAPFQGESLNWSILDWPRGPQRDLGLAVTACLMAILVLALTLHSGFRRRRGGAPGAFERLDAAMSRLILGRNL